MNNPEESLENSGFDPNFIDVMEKTAQLQEDREMPPVHPGNYAEVTDDEIQAGIDRRFGRNMFALRKKFRSRYGQFDLSVFDQREKLEKMVDNCLQKNWLLAREEWQHLKDGRTIVSVKFLIPEEKPKERKESDVGG